MAQVTIDVNARVVRKSLTAGASELQREMAAAGTRSGQQFGSNMASAIERQQPRIQAATIKVTDSVRKLTDAQRQLNDAIASGDWDAQVTASNRLTRAHDSHSRALKALDAAQSATLSGTAALATGAANAAGAMGKLGPAAGAAVVGLEAVAVMASSLTGALGLLPGVAAAAGAAIGTLALGTQGFGDALGNMRDPEKFAEALAQLSPNAATAAMGIQSLLPQFDALKNATQDALFANVGPELQQLSTTLLPQVQTLTTTVAGALNSMFTGVADELTNPATMAALNSTINNVGLAFQNLAPAAAPFTAAIAELTSVSSGFLPQLATAASDAATAFSAFISQASASGELEAWIQRAVDGLAQIGPLAMDMATAFIQLGPIGAQVLPLVVNGLSIMVDILNIAIPAFTLIADLASPFLNLWAPALSMVSDLVGGLGSGFEGLGGTVANVANSIIPILNNIGQTVNNVMAPLRAAASLTGVQIPEFQPIAQVGTPGSAGAVVPKTPGAPGGMSAADRWLQIDQQRTGNNGGLPPGAYRKRDGSIGYAAPPSMQTGGIPTPLSGPYATGGVGGGDSAGLPNPATPYSGDPLAVLREAGLTADSANYGAAQGILSKRHDVEEKRAKLAALEKSNTATQDELTRARNDVLEAEQDAYQAELSLRDRQIDSANSYAKAATQSQAAFSDLLDADFGISKGLPGIVENITRMLGAMAAAPWMRENGYVPGGQSGGQGGYSPLGSGYGGSAVGGGYPGDAALLASVGPGRYSQAGNRDLLAGLSDCSSSIGDLVAILDGIPTTEIPNLTTGNAASWLPQHGFLPGAGGPGDFRVAYNSGHMQATLPGGTPWNWGSDAAAARGGVGGSGADDPALTQRYYRPAASPVGQIGAPSLPVGMIGGGGTTPGMGMGMPQAMGQSPIGGPSMYGQSPIGQQQPVGRVPGSGGWQPGGSGGAASGGSALAAATSGAAMAANVMAPGAGEAVQKGGQLLERGIKFGGELAGIGVGGLMETFSLSGSETGDLSKSWLGRIASGLSGMRPAAETTAGQTKPPAEAQQHEGSGAAPGPQGLPEFTLRTLSKRPTETECRRPTISPSALTRAAGASGSETLSQPIVSALGPNQHE